jgi:hypothetical protein
VPGTAWALAHVALAAVGYGDRTLIPLLGAGHAGVVQLAFSWMTGDLEDLRPCFTADACGLAALSAAFPDVDGLGAEVVPGLPAGDFLGGRLGGCLAFAQGAGMDAPGRIMVPVLGDGECETPTTAASWMAHAVAAGTKVAPIVHVNGFRMGAPSLLAALGDEELRAWARGLGWEARIATVGSGSRSEHAAFRQALLHTMASTDSGRQALLIMRCRKGWGGPDVVGDRAITGTAHAHKTPLPLAATDGTQRAQLSNWLASYRPGELFEALQYELAADHGLAACVIHPLSLATVKPGSRLPDIHAGIGETSLMLHLAPGLVNMDALAGQGADAERRSEAINYLVRDRGATWPWSSGDPSIVKAGVIGDPRNASTGLGHAILTSALDAAARAVTRLAGVPDLARDTEGEP